MDAREIESLSMLSRGFTELGATNPELAYNVILDILSGINEWVACYYCKLQHRSTFAHPSVGMIRSDSTSVPNVVSSLIALCRDRLK